MLSPLPSIYCTRLENGLIQGTVCDPTRHNNHAASLDRRLRARGICGRPTPPLPLPDSPDDGRQIFIKAPYLFAL